MMITDTAACRVYDYRKIYDNGYCRVYEAPMDNSDNTSAVVTYVMRKMEWDS